MTFTSVLSHWTAAPVRWNLFHVFMPQQRASQHITLYTWYRTENQPPLPIRHAANTRGRQAAPPAWPVGSHSGASRALPIYLISCYTVPSERHRLNQRAETM